MVGFVKSKASYGARSKGNIPKDFADFICWLVDKSADEKDFKQVCLFFEAVVGFMYGLGVVQ